MPVPAIYVPSSVARAPSAEATPEACLEAFTQAVSVEGQRVYVPEEAQLAGAEVRSLESVTPPAEGFQWTDANIFDPIPQWAYEIPGMRDSLADQRDAILQPRLAAFRAEASAKGIAVDEGDAVVVADSRFRSWKPGSLVANAQVDHNNGKRGFTIDLSLALPEWLSFAQTRESDKAHAKAKPTRDADKVA